MGSEMCIRDRSRDILILSAQCKYDRCLGFLFPSQPRPEGKDEFPQAGGAGAITVAGQTKATTIQRDPNSDIPPNKHNAGVNSASLPALSDKQDFANAPQWPEEPNHGPARLVLHMGPLVDSAGSQVPREAHMTTEPQPVGPSRDRIQGGVSIRTLRNHRPQKENLQDASTDPGCSCEWIQVLSGSTGEEGVQLHHLPSEEPGKHFDSQHQSLKGAPEAPLGEDQTHSACISPSVAQGPWTSEPRVSAFNPELLNLSIPSGFRTRIWRNADQVRAFLTKHQGQGATVPTDNWERSSRALPQKGALLEGTVRAKKGEGGLMRSHRAAAVHLCTDNDHFVRLDSQQCAGPWGESLSLPGVNCQLKVRTVEKSATGLARASTGMLAHSKPPWEGTSAAKLGQCSVRIVNSIRQSSPTLWDRETESPRTKGVANQAKPIVTVLHRIRTPAFMLNLGQRTRKEGPEQLNSAQGGDPCRQDPKRDITTSLRGLSETGHVLQQDHIALNNSYGMASVGKAAVKDVPQINASASSRQAKTASQSGSPEFKRGSPQGERGSVSPTVGFRSKFPELSRGSPQGIRGSASLTTGFRSESPELRRGGPQGERGSVSLITGSRSESPELRWGGPNSDRGSVSLGTGFQSKSPELRRGSPRGRRGSVSLSIGFRSMTKSQELRQGSPQGEQGSVSLIIEFESPGATMSGSYLSPQTAATRASKGASSWQG